MKYLIDSIQKNEKIQKRNKKMNQLDENIIKIVEKFIIDNQLICYGGTAINNILPKEVQFYDFDIDIPDYDFFSHDAMNHAKQLCDLFASHDKYYVESKSAFFYGTYKVFVNFIPIADITQIHSDFYNYLLKNAIYVNDIPYTNDNFLRMSLHQELSRPYGDVSRWEKIYKRMNILNKYYKLNFIPVKNKAFPINNNHKKSDVHDTTKKDIIDFLVHHSCMFCNIDLVNCIYKKFVQKKQRTTLKCSSYNKVLYNGTIIAYCDDIRAMKQKFNKSMKRADTKLKVIPSKYKFLKDYIEIYIEDICIGIVLEYDSCVSFFEQKLLKNKHIKIGSIDTLLSCYYALLLVDNLKINISEIEQVILTLHFIVMHYEKKYIPMIEKSVDMSKIKALTRFNLPCIGDQEDYTDILKKRFKKYKELKKEKSSIEYKKWFFKYIPRSSVGNKNNKVKHNRTVKIKSNKNITKKTQDKTI